MHNHKGIITKAFLHNPEAFIETLDKHIEEKEEFMYDVDVSVYGEHFCKEIAEEAVKHMEHDDGSKGEHWNHAQIEEMARTKALCLEKEPFNIHDLYYTMNMMYSDYCEIFKDDVETYYKLSMKFLKDIDGPIGKAKKYFYLV